MPPRAPAAKQPDPTAPAAKPAAPSAGLVAKGLDAAGIGLLQVDGDGRVQQANAAAARLLGASADALTATALADWLTDPTPLDGLLAGEPLAEPLRLAWTTAGGLATVCRTSGTPARGGGALLVLDGTPDNSRVVEDADQLQRCVELAQIGTWRIDLRQMTMTCSARCKVNFGLGPNDAMPYERLFELMDDRDRERVANAVGQSIEHRTEYNVEYRVVWPDGSHHWIAARGRALYAADGTPETMVGITQNITARRLAQEAIHAREARQSEELLALDSVRREASAVTLRLTQRLRLMNALVESSTDFVGYSSMDRDWVVLNPAGCRMVGLVPQGDAPGMPLSELYAPEVSLFVQKEIFPALLRDGRWEGETRLRHTVTGEAIPVQQHAFVVRDPQTGEALGLAEINRDLRAAKKADEATQRMIALGDNSTDLIAFSGKKGELLYINPGGRRLLGLSADIDVTQFKVSEFFPPEDWARMLGEVLPATRATGKWEGEIRFRHFGSDRLIPFLHQTFVVHDSAGHFTGMATIARDITNRKREEEILRTSEQRLRIAVAITGMGTWKLDLRANTLEFDDRHAQIIGLPPGTRRLSLLTEVFPIIHPDDLRYVQDELAQALDPQADGTYQVEHRLVMAKGKTRWVYAVGQVHYEEEGGVRTPVALVGSTLDITDRKLTEQALARTQAELTHVTRVRSMGELASSISHEINQPLAAILTNNQAGLRWLANEPPNVDQARESMRRSVRDAQRAGEIIHRVRGFIKKTAGDQGGSVDVVALLNETLAIMRSEVLARNVQLLHNVAAALPPVQGAAVELQQVLVNLMMNGMEAMAAKADGERLLTVQASPDARAAGVRITVTDTGSGLPNHDGEKPFEAFYTTKSTGLGMGLAICRSIVESHGGRIWATPGSHAGASFHVWLPAQTATIGKVSAQGDKA